MLLCKVYSFPLFAPTRANFPLLKGPATIPLKQRKNTGDNPSDWQNYCHLLNISDDTGQISSSYG